MKKMAIDKIPIFIFILTISWLGGIFLTPSIAEGAGYLGHQKNKGCTKCHREQYESWEQSAHARAMESLKPGIKTEEKKKAKLKLNKDYTKDEVCLKCHTTGFQMGGYVDGNKKKAKKFSNVGCEVCHGAGKKYMKVKNKYEKDDFTRKEVIKAGLRYGQKKYCEECHNKKSPFKARVDPKYKFDYAKMLKKGTHKHYKQSKHPTRYSRKIYWEYEKE